MCCFHALEHYSQHFSKKRNLVRTPFTVCNCPNWIRTNITRVKFLCANLYTIEQCVGCKKDWSTLQPTSYNRLRKNALKASCLCFNDFNHLSYNPMLLINNHLRRTLRRSVQQQWFRCQCLQRRASTARSAYAERCHSSWTSG